MWNCKKMYYIKIILLKNLKIPKIFNYKTNVKIHYVKSLYVFYFKYYLRIFKKKMSNIYSMKKIAILTKNVNIVLPKKTIYRTKNIVKC